MSFLPRPVSVTGRGPRRPAWHQLLCVLVLVVLAPAAGQAAVLDHRSSPLPALSDEGSLPPSVATEPAGRPRSGNGLSADRQPGTRPDRRVGAHTAGSPAPSDPVTSEARWNWPLIPTPRVAEPFRAPEDRWSSGHRGVDLHATGDQPTVGHLVLAPADGAIAFTGKVVNRGVLTINHPGGLRSSFEPVEATLPVGTVVRRGDPVAVVTEGGHTSGSLHWGVRHGNQYLDPLLLLQPRSPPVLLPLRPVS